MSCLYVPLRSTTYFRSEPIRSRLPMHKEVRNSVARLREYFSVESFCEEFEINRSTFYKWRAKGTAPRCKKLPNGEIRIRRTDVELWLDTLGGTA